MVGIIVSITQVLIALTDMLPKLVALCAVVAAIVPPAKDGFWGGVYKVINGLALNVGHAKNIEAPSDDA